MADDWGSFVLFCTKIKYEKSQSVIKFQSDKKKIEEGVCDDDGTRSCCKDGYVGVGYYKIKHRTPGEKYPYDLVRKDMLDEHELKYCESVADGVPIENLIFLYHFHGDFHESEDSNV